MRQAIGLPPHHCYHKCVVLRRLAKPLSFTFDGHAAKSVEESVPFRAIYPI